jgi:hypothetical protein
MIEIACVGYSPVGYFEKTVLLAKKLVVQKTFQIKLRLFVIVNDCIGVCRVQTGEIM